MCVCRKQTQKETAGSDDERDREIGGANDDGNGEKEKKRIVTGIKLESNGVMDVRPTMTKQ